MPGKWELRDNAHTAEVCRALVRVPVIKHVQIAKLVGIREEQAFRLVHHAYHELIRRPYRQEKHRSTRYTGTQGLRSYVQLTREAAAVWGEHENITPRIHLRSNDLIRYLATMNVLVELKTAGVLYDEWDMNLPQEEGTPFHAVLTHQESGYRLGLYFLPEKYGGDKRNKKLSVLRGIVRKVDQKATVDGVLYLVPRVHYADALRVFLKLDLASHSSFLLPTESFTENPRHFLWAIRVSEAWHLSELLRVLKPVEQLPRPVQYNFATLVKFEDDRYRLIDTYVAGDVRRIRDWLYDTRFLGMTVPETGKVASAQVFVFDDWIHDVLSGFAAQLGALAATEFYRWQANATSSDVWDVADGQQNL